MSCGVMHSSSRFAVVVLPCSREGERERPPFSSAPAPASPCRSRTSWPAPPAPVLPREEGLQPLREATPERLPMPAMPRAGSSEPCAALRCAPRAEAESAEMRGRMHCALTVPLQPLRGPMAAKSDIAGKRWPFGASRARVVCHTRWRVLRCAVQRPIPEDPGYIYIYRMAWSIVPDCWHIRLY